MKCQACQVLKFEPLDTVQKLASSERTFNQTLGTSLALSRKAIAAASATKAIGSGVRGVLNALPSKLRSKVEKPRIAEVLHNSVYILHESLDQLELSAASGCEFCRLVWGGLRCPIVKQASAKKNSCCDTNVRLYLSAYRALNPEHTLSHLSDQYITIECGDDRSMCLEITAGKAEPLDAGSVVTEHRSTLLKRAVRGFPSQKPNKNGTFDFDLAQVDLNKVDIKVQQGSMELSFDQIKRSRVQMIEKNYVTMRSLGGLIDLPAYEEGSEAAEDDHTGSKVNLKRAIGWLTLCQQSHDLCACTTDPYTPLPTRVIDLGPVNTSRDPNIYHSRGEHARYCTLSHRWGSATVLKTTNDNLQLHKRQLPLKDLSATFKDAIKICRELCIRYLWIDSLCIIQDSREDWEQESSRMGDYYWNSFFTIAADHATEKNQGCFRQRDPCSIQPCLVALTFPQDIDKAIAAVRVTPRIQEGDDWRYKQYSILDTRSWVLQERILSPRTLFFGEHQLSFSCISMRASESTPEGSERTGIKVQAPFEEFQRKIRMYTVSDQSNISNLQNTELPKPEVKINGQSGQIRVSVDPEVNKEVDPRFLRELHDNWYELLREYNKRSITQKSDVLPALSGLAKRFQETIGETYLAGLWSGDMKAGLLWSVDETSQRSTTYRAPSWSWASLRTCRLRFNCLSENVTNDNLCRIFKAEVSSRGPNIYGEVTDGKLYVKGLLKKATVVIPQKAMDARDEKKEVPDMDVRYEADGDLHFREIGDAMDLEKGDCAFLEDVDTKEQLCKFEPDGKFDMSNTLVVCLPLLLQRNMFGAEAALCLVLQPNFPEEPTWRRVGFARTLKVDWFTDTDAYPMVIV